MGKLSVGMQPTFIVDLLSKLAAGRGEGIPLGGRLIFRIRDRIKHFIQGVLAWLQVTTCFLEAPTQPLNPQLRQRVALLLQA